MKNIWIHSEKLQRVHYYVICFVFVLHAILLDTLLIGPLSLDIVLHAILLDTASDWPFVFGYLEE
jgi:hypothetical protein